MNRSHTIKGLQYLLAPVCTGAAAVAMVYAALKLTLPEAFVQYSVLLTVFAFISVGFYVITSLPCNVMAALHSICAMVKDRKFVFPSIFLVLDLALIACWVQAVRQIMLSLEQGG